MIEGKTKKPIKGFKSKAGNPFESILVFNRELNKIEMTFEENKESKSAEVVSLSRYEIFEKEKVFEVTEKESGNNFIIYKNNSGKKLTLTIVKELLELGKTKKKIKGFKSNAGKSYEAFLVFDVHSKQLTKAYN